LSYDIVAKTTTYDIVAKGHCLVLQLAGSAVQFYEVVVFIALKESIHESMC